MKFVVSDLIHFDFNSRLREGTNTFFQVFFKRTFSITTHISPRRRTDSYCLEYCAREFQLASPQGDEHNCHERELPNAKYIYTTISTHVSVRRRTIQIMQNAEHFVISTRVSARETNPPAFCSCPIMCNFNSRLRKETNKGFFWYNL